MNIPSTPHPVQATSDQVDCIPNATRPLTLGEYRVGISFNPGGNRDVDEIKRAAADLIDLCESYRTIGHRSANAEAMRLLSLAQTNIEDAAMWAVKAVTKPAR